MSDTKNLDQLTAKPSWVGAVLALDLALESKDLYAALRAHVVLDRLAKRNREKRAVVHDYGNRVQHLIFERHLAGIDEEAEAQDGAIDPSDVYHILPAEQDAV